MRLLKRSGEGKPELHTFDNDDDLPPYAVLSHFWVNGEEVSYAELQSGTLLHKSGYQKIQWTLHMAGLRGLNYVWIDTCCIDKSDAREVASSINSMFKWYQGAAECYVFLGDCDRLVNFSDSYWWTRGWTLQELIAPRIVLFYSRLGDLLGTRSSLELFIRQKSNVPLEVLRGEGFMGYSFDECMSWVAGRNTKYAEDKVYCMLGLFGVFLSLIYGEGEAHALQRVREEVEKRHGVTSRMPGQAMLFTPAQSQSLIQNFYVDGHLVVNTLPSYHQANTNDSTQYYVPRVFQQTAQTVLPAWMQHPATDDIDHEKYEREYREMEDYFKIIREEEKKARSVRRIAPEEVAQPRPSMAATADVSDISRCATSATIAKSVR